MFSLGNNVVEVEPHPYQIYVRSFADSNADGIGDLAGIASRVDYLEDLGVDTVLLSPVNSTTNHDNGYDVTDYLDIDPGFGTLADWNRLRDALHDRGMKLMMDLVLNHTSDAHPWFLQERRYKALLRLLETSSTGDAVECARRVQTALQRVIVSPDAELKFEHEGGEECSAILRLLESFRQDARLAAAAGYYPVGEQFERLRQALYGSAEQRQQAHRKVHDFYLWRDSPNNWTSIFSRSAWLHAGDANGWYLALFSPHQPELNWSNPAVRRAMYNVVQAWADRGVDGFRLDSAAFVAKHGDFLDAPADDTARVGRGMRYFVNQPQVRTWLRELSGSVLSNLPLRTVGEVSFTPVEAALDYAGFDRHELTEVFVFDHMYTDFGRDKWDVQPFNLPAFKKTIDRQQEVVHNRAWLANYLENHDQLRAVSRFGDDGRYRVESAKMLATLLFTLEGTPYINQGQEIGMTNAEFTKIEDVDDIEARNFYSAAVDAGASPDEVMRAVAARNRDNVRTVMQWGDSPNAGFTKDTPWIQVNKNYKTVNVEGALADNDSVLAYYKRLIALRKRHDAWVNGAFHDLLPDDPHLFMYVREQAHSRSLVVLDFSDKPQLIPQEPDYYVGGPVKLLISNYSPASARESANTDCTLRPFEARVYTNY